MDNPDVESVLITRLAESRASTREEVLLDLERTGAIDSLEGLELAIEAEQAFGIAISDSELSSDVCRSIPELASLVRSKLSSKGEAEGEMGR